MFRNCPKLDAVNGHCSYQRSALVCRLDALRRQGRRAPDLHYIVARCNEQNTYGSPQLTIFSSNHNFSA